MRTIANYERPEMEICIFELEDTIRTSLTDGGSGSGGSSGLPTDINLTSF